MLASETDMIYTELIFKVPKEKLDLDLFKLSSD